MISVIYLLLFGKFKSKINKINLIFNSTFILQIKNKNKIKKKQNQTTKIKNT